MSSTITTPKIADTQHGIPSLSDRALDGADVLMVAAAAADLSASSTAAASSQQAVAAAVAPILETDPDYAQAEAGGWVIVPAELNELPPLFYPRESVRSGSPTMNRVVALATYYLGRSPDVELTPRCEGGPSCLSQAEEVIRKGKFMGASTALDWIEQMREAQPADTGFFTDFLTAGKVLDFADVSANLRAAIQARAPGATLFVPMILASGRLSNQHIVCLAISDQGLEYFDSQQTPIKESAARALSCGGSLGQLLSEAWITLGEALPPEKMGRMNIVGNTETNAIQRDSWSCGVYVLSYMRERMQGRDHAGAMASLAQAPLNRLHQQLWIELNQPTAAEKKRHALTTLVAELETVVRDGLGRSFDEVLPRARAAQSGIPVEAEEEEAAAAEGFESVDCAPASPLHAEVLLAAFSEAQSVQCFGLCSSSAEIPGEGHLVRFSREQVVHQVTIDVLRKESVTINGQICDAEGNEETAAGITEELVTFFEQKLSACLPGADPHVATQLLGLCNQAAAAAPFAVLSYAVSGLSRGEQEGLVPTMLSGHPASCLKTVVDQEGLKRHIDVACTLRDARNEENSSRRNLLLSVDYQIAWNDLPRLVQGEEGRLDLTEVKATLTISPMDE